MTRFGLSATLLLLAMAPPLGADDLRAEVERILAAPGSGSAQQAEQLARLGRSAVPTLIERLSREAHPMVLVQALGLIGDPRATPPLLDLLRALQPFTDVKGQHEAERVIVLEALREIGDPGAEPTLRRILSKGTAMSTRLGAAAALARFGSPDARGEARAFILSVEQEVRAGRYRRLHVAGPFRPIDLDQALFELGTDEGRGLLAGRLERSQLADEELGIVGLLARQPDAGAVEALLAFCEREAAEPYVRWQAARALAKMGPEVPHARLVQALLRLRDRLPPPLRAEADELLGRL